jgi:uncharacterized SAM-dependent methyltransferase
MGSYMYPDPLSQRDPVRGSELWELAAEDVNYRLLRDEEKILRDPAVLDWMKHHIPSRLTVLDMASGFTVKSRLLLQALCGVSSYIAVDQTESFARRTADLVKDAFPSVRTGFVVHDIINGGPPTVTEEIENPLMVLFGGLLANGVWPAGKGVSDADRLGMVMKEVGRVFTDQMPFFEYKGHIISTWQVCDPEDPQAFKESIESSYNSNKALGQVLLNGLRLIKSDLDVKGLDCRAFDYRADWVPEQMRVRLNVVSRKAQNFTIEGRDCHLDAGEPVTLVNSFKFTPDALNAIFNDAGFRSVTHLTIPDNRIDLVVTEAPPAAWRSMLGTSGHLKVQTSFAPPTAVSPVEMLCRRLFSDRRETPGPHDSGLKYA